ncbi:MAG: SMC family ATPase [Chloroflexi bacterium]|nr:SMC family ATPase [Chloroflexota bacterium]
MIPLRLRLRNFMCYGENVPPLSFEGIHVACLCGDNGSGKSALLDAMTWALWGKSRADADDDLIYRDRADMEVDFEFIAQGKGYRVLRKHGRGTAARSGSTLLTLQSAGEGVYNDISGNTKSETQQKLIELLRLDYKTFRNSAYLVQGKANEFTVADPAERKRVLAAILDLSQYDELSDMAHDRSVERGNEGSRLEGIITGMEAEIATKPSCLSDLASHQSLLMAAEARRAEAEKDLNATEQASKDLEIKQSQLKLLQSSQAQASAELSRWMQRSRVLTSQIAEYEGVEAEQEAIVAGHTSLLLQDAENAQLNEKAQRLLELTAGAARLALAIERAQNMVLAEHDSSQKKLDEARTKAATLPDLEAQAARTRAELQVLAATEEALVEKRRRAAELTSAADNTRSNNERLSAEVRQIEEKLAMLSAKGARCPLCQSDLGEDGVERVRANYQAERAEKRRYIREGAGQAETSASERRSIEAEIARIEPVMKAEKASRQTRLGRLEHEIAAAREAAASIGADQERLAQLERRLAERDFATVEQKAYVELSTQISALAYDPAHHNEVKRRLRDSAQFQAKWNHLEQALKRLPQMRSDLAATEETIAERRLQIDSERNRIDELARETSALPALANRVNEERTQYQSALRNEKLAREQDRPTTGISSQCVTTHSSCSTISGTARAPCCGRVTSTAPSGGSKSLRRRWHVICARVCDCSSGATPPLASWKNANTWSHAASAMPSDFLPTRCCGSISSICSSGRWEDLRRSLSSAIMTSSTKLGAGTITGVWWPKWSGTWESYFPGWVSS